MPSLGKSINLYLMDGSASGRWQASLSNWNGVAYKIPRSELKDCDDLPDLNAPGVYFLFGKDDDSGKQFIYIGEADDVLKRLLQPHTFEKDESYWTEAVIFVTPDGTLEKGRVKYLENRFYTIAVEAKRYIVKNGNTPTQSPMQRQIRDLLEGFIINVKLVLPVLGHRTFAPIPSSEKEEADEENDLLYFSRNRGQGGRAVGKVTADGFWVLKGSYIYPQVANYVSSGIKKAREKYFGIIDKNGMLQEDICFGSPSFASAFVCGKISNGLAEWKNQSGVSLKNLDSNDNRMTHDQKQEKTKADFKAETLHLAGKKVSATGQLSGDGFIVFKGSGFSASETKSCQAWIRKKRAQLLIDGKVKGGLFIEDVYFTSTSAAAGCVTGASANGNTMWLYADGQSIKEKNHL